MNIVIAGHFGFPRGSASASRIRLFARGLTELGHRLFVLPMSPLPEPPTAPGRNGWLDHDGVAWSPVGGWVPRDERRPVAKKLKVQWHLLYGSQTKAVAQLASVHRTHGVDMFIGYSTLHFGMQRLIGFCQEQGIPLVRDVVEWHQPNAFSGGWLHPAYWNTWLCMRASLPKSDGIIAISSCLAEAYAARGVKVMRTPAVIDPEEWVFDPVPDEFAAGPFRLTYVGDLHQRDTPLVILAAVDRLLVEGRSVQLNLVGNSGLAGMAAKARRVAEGNPRLREHVRFCGRVPDAELRQHLHESSALLFTRRSGLAARAAFPTRLPEFLMTGRPVIASAVSDIPEYLRDGQEAVLVAPDSPDALAEGIRTLMDRPDAGRAIGEAGRRKCMECFHFRPRCRQISEFLEEIVGDRTRSSDAGRARSGETHLCSHPG